MKGAETIIKDFTKNIEELNGRKLDPLKHALQGIAICNKALSRLKAWVEKNDFESIPLEIYFFKNLKPVPMGHLIYFTEMRTCQLQMPKAGVQYQVGFLEKELKKINKFFYRNSDFVHYLELGYTYLDHQYFSRTKNPEYPVTPLANYYQFPEFSTTHDMLLCKVRAMNKLIHYIRGLLEDLRPGQNHSREQKQHKVLVWTGSKTALIELIYALYSDEILNHGAADLKTITSGFEDFFNIKLDQIYKTYSEIKERRGSRTKFLDELTVHLQYKMDQDEQ